MEEIRAAVARRGFLGHMGDISTRCVPQHMLSNSNERQVHQGIKELNEFSHWRPSMRLYNICEQLLEAPALPHMQLAEKFGWTSVEMPTENLYAEVFVRGEHTEVLSVSRRRQVHQKVYQLLVGGSPKTNNYDKAFERLKYFVEEELDWDGCNGQPASDSTAFAVSRFLSMAQTKGISRPSLTLSNSGAVSVIWNRGRNYVTIHFQGCTKFVAIVLENGESKLALERPAMDFPKELEDHLLENFKEDVTFNLFRL